MSDQWLETFLSAPPRSLSELERLVGPLDVDFAGEEGSGSVWRPAHVLVDGSPQEIRRGALRPEVESLVATFRFDTYHEDPHRPRDMRLETVTLVLAMPAESLRRLVERRLGEGRLVERPAGSSPRQYFEYGSWFYVSTRRSAIEFAVAQHEWALPARSASALDSFLDTLVALLATEPSEGALSAALGSGAAAAGASIRRPIRFGDRGSDGFGISFQPRIPIASVVRAFKWHDAAASSRDVHMSSWSAGPLSALTVPPWRPVVGAFEVEVLLDGWPRGPGGADLPAIGAEGPSRMYDIAQATSTVGSIEVFPTR